MVQPSGSAGTALRDHPGLLAALVFAGLTAFVATLVVLRTPADPASVVFYGLGPLLFTSVGVVILTRIPGQGVGRLALIIGLVLSVSASLTFAITLVDPPGSVQVLLPGLAGTVLEVVTTASVAIPSIALFVGGTLLVVWFPDGRPSSRIGVAAEVLLAVGILAAIASAAKEPVVRALGYSPALEALFDSALGLAFLALIGAYGLAILDLTRRYRSSDAVRRTQMRWVLGAVIVEVTLTIGAFVLSDRVPVIWPLWIVSTILPIVAVAVAITRYRLYDIDRIISQTLTYAVLTAVLFVTFAGVNLLLQRLISPATGDNAIATAVSTLCVAALFDPARGRIQRAVDRRFHRARYDAERTVQRFAGHVRDQVDLATLTSELRRASAESVEPSSTAVWLRPREGGA